jgi:hypothetical protein
MRTSLIMMVLALAAAAAAACDDPGARTFNGRPITPTLTDGDRTFRAGDRVEVISRAGTLKPRESGHPREVSFDPGRTGTFRGATKVVSTDGIEREVALVHWDAQRWREWSAPYERMQTGVMYGVDELERMAEKDGRMVLLPALDATIHPSYLKIR